MLLASEDEIPALEVLDIAIDAELFVALLWLDDSIGCDEEEAGSDEAVGVAELLLSCGTDDWPPPVDGSSPPPPPQAYRPLRSATIRVRPKTL